MNEKQSIYNFCCQKGGWWPVTHSWSCGWMDVAWLTRMFIYGPPSHHSLGSSFLDHFYDYTPQLFPMPYAYMPHNFFDAPSNSKLQLMLTSSWRFILHHLCKPKKKYIHINIILASYSDSLTIECLWQLLISNWVIHIWFNVLYMLP